MSELQRNLMSAALIFAESSPDPSTKVGALIYTQGSIVCSGYNHIPRRIPYSAEMLMDREWKYPRIIHAEQHALSKFHIFGAVHPVMYVTHYPCERCAAHMILAGITEVFTRKPQQDMMDRWPGMRIAAEMFMEAKIPVNFVEL